MKELICERCGIKDWNDEEIVFEVHHIDGNKKNNKLENLMLLCPNCHSQTENFRGKNINCGSKKISDKKILETLKSTKNIRQALIKLGLAPMGGNYSRIKKLIKNLIDE